MQFYSVIFSSLFLFPSVLSSTSGPEDNADYDYVNQKIPTEAPEEYESYWEKYFGGRDFYPEEFVHDIDELEAILGGPLEGRKFITEIKLGLTGKAIEREYKFQTNAREKRRSIDQLNPKDAKQIVQPPSSFNWTTVYVHYTHRLMEVERRDETHAKIGDFCTPTNYLEPDFCERAAYPNKDKMFCNMVDDPINNLKKNTCTCKFYRENPRENRWKQLTRAKLNINRKEIETCLVPNGGVCSHRIYTGLRDPYGGYIYEVDICQGHFQCDNSPYYTKALEVHKHCTDEEFMRNFNKKHRDNLLLCSKPHPRRFADYDEFKYYCLPKKSQDPEQYRFKPPPPDDIEHDNDILKSP